MKRLMQGLVIGVLVLAGGVTAAMPAEPEATYRYLIVLENSARMERQREVALDTVHQLILSGIHGRIREGEMLGIWTYRDRLRQDQFRPIRWGPGRARDVANDVYRTLRDDGFSREPDLDQAMLGVHEAAQVVDRLTVFLVVSGTQRIRGSAFDAEINQVYEQHADAMRKNRKPFVTVLVMENGQTVGHATSPGGRPVYIPPLTEAATTAAPDAKPAKAATEEPPAMVEPESAEAEVVKPTPRPEVLSVAEIEKRLREAEEERIRRQAEAEARHSQPLEPVEEQSLRELAPAGAEVPMLELPAAVDLEGPAQAMAVPSIEPGPVVAGELAAVQLRDGGGDAPARSEGGVGRRSEAETADRSVKEETEVPKASITEVGGAAKDEEDVVAVPGMMVAETGLARWGYLAAGVSLLLMAGMLSMYLYQRAGPRRVRPSAISQSLDRY